MPPLIAFWKTNSEMLAKVMPKPVKDWARKPAGFCPAPVLRRLRTATRRAETTARVDTVAGPAPRTADHGDHGPRKVVITGHFVPGTIPFGV